MIKLSVEAIKDLPDCKSSEITRIDYDLEHLRILLTDVASGNVIEVLFHHPIGYRVLDEGDLLEFWPSCSQDQGYVFRIISGGWFDLERSREGCFLSGLDHVQPEYLVTGNNDCVSVISCEPPTVEFKNLA